MTQESADKSVMLQQNVNMLQEFDSTDEDESDDDDLEAELAKLNSTVETSP